MRAVSQSIDMLCKRNACLVSMVWLRWSDGQVHAVGRRDHLRAGAASPLLLALLVPSLQRRHPADK